jgi:glutamyl-tRNA reductase
VIVVVGLSHKNAPIEVRERIAIGRDALPDVLRSLCDRPEIGEAVVLSTCNRVEVYAAPPRGGVDLHAAVDAARGSLAAIAGDKILPHLKTFEGDEAVHHLFRVAASLDSLVVGEPQILGQLKEAIDIARETRAIGQTLHQAMHRAVRVGKRVRTETQIGAGQVSVSSVAIELAQQIFGELAGKRALLVGAGEMAEAAAKLLARAGAKILIVNRSPERAQDLARELGREGEVEARPWSDLEKSLVDSDIVVSSTSSPRYVITRDMAKAASKARRGRSLFLIDIAVPRDVEPSVNNLDNVYLYDVDNLSEIVAQSLEGRAQEAQRAEKIVREEAGGFEAWRAEQALTPTIVKLRARTRAILVSEVERSLAGKLRHLGAPEREALTVMIDAMTNKLLHAPTTRLKGLATDTRLSEVVESLSLLFDLPESEEAGGSDAVPSPRPRAGSSANQTQPDASRRGEI